MVNAWSLAASILNGTFDEDYPIMKKKEVDEKTGLWTEPEPYYGYENDGLDYEVDLSTIDDMYSHHFTTYDDGMSLQVTEKKMSAHYFKYHEKEILKDIEEYVSRTYQGHYTGKSHEYRNVQTLDLMAAKELASGFCQANILKYGSRYGNKDGKNTKDLMKVIHYAMLLLHFDGHYGKPSMSTGNIDQIDHNMP